MENKKHLLGGLCGYYTAILNQAEKKGGCLQGGGTMNLGCHLLFAQDLFNKNEGVSALGLTSYMYLTIFQSHHDSSIPRKTVLSFH